MTAFSPGHVFLGRLLWVRIPFPFLAWLPPASHSPCPGKPELLEGSILGVFFYPGFWGQQLRVKIQMSLKMGTEKLHRSSHILKFIKNSYSFLNIQVLMGRWREGLFLLKSESHVSSCCFTKQDSFLCSLQDCLWGEWSTSDPRSCEGNGTSIMIWLLHFRFR